MNFKRINLYLSLLLLCLSHHAFAFDFNKYNAALMIQVQKSDGESYICSSVAYSPNKLLTAAHCLENAKKIRVFKEYRSLAENSFYEVETFEQHPRYNKKSSNYLYDLGLIKLTEDLPISINIPPISYLKDTHNEIHRVGFGRRNGVNSRTIIFPIIQYRLEENYIDCLDNFSYSGDSGGPLFEVENDKLLLVGIHSTKKGEFSLNPQITDEIKFWADNY